jgi:hypothetical protein
MRQPPQSDWRSVDRGTRGQRTSLSLPQDIDHHPVKDALAGLTVSLTKRARSVNSFPKRFTGGDLRAASNWTMAAHTAGPLAIIKRLNHPDH